MLVNTVKCPDDVLVFQKYKRAAIFTAWDIVSC